MNAKRLSADDAVTFFGVNLGPDVFSEIGQIAESHFITLLNESALGYPVDPPVTGRLYAQFSLTRVNRDGSDLRRSGPVMPGGMVFSMTAAFPANRGCGVDAVQHER